MPLFKRGDSVLSFGVVSLVSSDPMAKLKWTQKIKLCKSCELKRPGVEQN